MIEQSFRTIIDGKTTWNVSLNRAIENQVAPYIVVSRISGPRAFTLDGADGTAIARFQVDLFGSDYKTVKEQSALIYSVQSITTQEIAFISLENEIDMYEDVPNLHHIVLTFIVRYYEQIGD